MEKFQTVKVLGDGSFGTVLLVQDKLDKKYYAVKKMKKRYKTWQDCMQLRELKSLKKLCLSSPQTIIKLIEVIRQNEELFFVFEYMQGNLYQIVEKWKQNDWQLTDHQISHCFGQLSDGLAFIHSNGYFHRDMKLENILVSTLPTSPAHFDQLLPYSADTSASLLYKIADFGLAREIRSAPPYTDYVSTRWYRAPELLLRSTFYSPAIDIWALGVILFELYKLDAMFAGNSDIEMFYLISSALGSPTLSSGEWNEWKEGFSMAAKLSFKLPTFPPKTASEIQTKLREMLPGCHEDAIIAIRDTLRWDPNKRPSAASLLTYKFLKMTRSTSKSSIPNLMDQYVSKYTPSSRESYGTALERQPLPAIKSPSNIHSKYEKNEREKESVDPFFSKLLNEDYSSKKYPTLSLEGRSLPVNQRDPLDKLTLNSPFKASTPLKTFKSSNENVIPSQAPERGTIYDTKQYEIRPSLFEPQKFKKETVYDDDLSQLINSVNNGKQGYNNSNKTSSLSRPSFLSQPRNNPFQDHNSSSSKHADITKDKSLSNNQSSDKWIPMWLKRR